MTQQHATSTVMTTNNAYDTILLVDAEDRVLSAWQADARVVADYLRDGARASEWDEDAWHGFDDSCHRIEDYGEECGRDGQIEDRERREFWCR